MDGFIGGVLSGWWGVVVGHAGERSRTGRSCHLSLNLTRQAGIIFCYFMPFLWTKSHILPYNFIGLEVNVRRVPNLRISSEDDPDANLPVP